MYLTQRLLKSIFLYVLRNAALELMTKEKELKELEPHTSYFFERKLRWQNDLLYLRGVARVFS